MKIGELAAQAECDVQTVRYYEREGLMAEPARTEGNYRFYGPDHLARLVFIRHCRALDMALGEIRQLLRFKDAPHENCGGVNGLLDAHIWQVTRRIEELAALQSELVELRSRCSEARDAKDCQILEELSRRSFSAGGE